MAGVLPGDQRLHPRPLHALRSAQASRPSLHARRYLAPLGLGSGFVDATGGGGWGRICHPDDPRDRAVRAAEGHRLGRRDERGVALVALAASIGFLLSSEEARVAFKYVAALLIGGASPPPSRRPSSSATSRRRCSGIRRWPDPDHEHAHDVRRVDGVSGEVRRPGLRHARGVSDAVISGARSRPGDSALASAGNLVEPLLNRDERSRHQGGSLAAERARVALEHRGHALADADAERRQPVPAITSAELVKERDHEPGAAHPQRVAECDRTSVDVHVLRDPGRGRG